MADARSRADERSWGAASEQQRAMAEAEDKRVRRYRAALGDTDPARHPAGDRTTRGVHGPHRGRGPRDEVRPDARLLELVSDRLMDDPDLDAGDIEVTVDDGEVTLRGTVQDRAARRRAEDLAASVRGVRHVTNDLRVG
jgi:osmotically-inducible protein OsmY